MDQTSGFSMHETWDVPYIKEKKEWAEKLKELHKNVTKYSKAIPDKEITLEFMYFDA